MRYFLYAYILMTTPCQCGHRHPTNRSHADGVNEKASWLIDKKRPGCTHPITNTYVSIEKEGIMKTITPTELRSNIYKILDEILNSGVPLEINKGGRRLRIIPVAKSSEKLAGKKPVYRLIENPELLLTIYSAKTVKQRR